MGKQDGKGYTTYAEAGVNLDVAEEVADNIRDIVDSTRTEACIGELGSFGGLFSARALKEMDHPILVNSTDGPGTKLKLAFWMDKHDTIGIDIVGMAVNDVAVFGAEVLYFLDYISMWKIVKPVQRAIVKGLADGCKQAGCALIGGETAEMPGMYAENEYDCSGFAVGVVDKFRMITGADVEVGNAIIGIGSNGLHANGYSLVRKVCFEERNMKVTDHVEELGCTLGEELLRPTRIYVKAILHLIQKCKVNGLAHISGGGVMDKISRILPNDCSAILKEKMFYGPPVFNFLQTLNPLPQLERLRTFNNGVGFVAIVPATVADMAIQELESVGEKAFNLGEIIQREDDPIIIE